jgi:hypothetical protein
MAEPALTLARPGSFQVSALIADGGPEATKRFFEFFTVPILNRNTRIAYYHAIGQFLDWCQRAGFRQLEDLEPIHVAAYTEQHADSPATVKQHMAAIRMLFSYLTEKGVLAMNPAREVQTERFSRLNGQYKHRCRGRANSQAYQCYLFVRWRSSKRALWGPR